MTDRYSFFATTSRFMEDLLAAEVRDAGGADPGELPGGVSFSGTLETGYRLCLWSRVASRVLLVIDKFPVARQEALYEGVFNIPWPEHFRRKHTFAVDAFVKDAVFTHSGFTARRVKDAIADRFRKDTGARPDVDTRQPDIRINLYLRKNEAVVSIDLSGESLHRRHYRMAAGVAPLKENLAAAILYRGRWPEIAGDDGGFSDPMCGSGTLPLEAALMAADIAPGILRKRFGFHRWLGRDETLWKTLLAEATDRRAAGLSRLPVIMGFDRDRAAIRIARENIAAAGLEKHVTVEHRELPAAGEPGKQPDHGLVAVNPPYGIRMRETSSLTGIYGELGTLLAEKYRGWQAAVITAAPELTKSMGLRSHRNNTLYNGPLQCRLYHFDLAGETIPEMQFRKLPVDNFENRIRKNLKHLKKWAARNAITSYRIYDADIPEFAVSVDYYENKWCVVNEYAPPRSVDQRLAERRLHRIMEVLPRLLGIHPENAFLKIRKRQRGTGQYDKFQDQGKRFIVREQELKFLVNFTDYLDTGLFLDHRPMRRRIREQAENKRFLNLFAYTGTATVAAAAGGARNTTTVDASNTYLDWAEDNIALNGFSGDNHQLVRADCMTWLRETNGVYDLIFLDPPTYSTSHGLAGRFDIQTDHPALIQAALDHLGENGTLYFSTNFRKFRMAAEIAAGNHAEEITRRTIPEDFRRTPGIHRVWRFRGNPETGGKQA